MENEKLLEYAALAESASSPPHQQRASQKAYGKPSRPQPRAGHPGDRRQRRRRPGWTACSVAAGNDKLMERLGVPYIPCHSVGTIIHMAMDGKYAGHIVISDVVKPTAQRRRARR